MSALSGHNRRLSVAPMMDWTDRHCRYFHRLIAPDALLYTEMVTTGALLHGDAERHLRHNVAEYPLALQLGGSDPDELKQAARMGAEAGFQEINLNCGCPSDRVQKGRFGACLMAEPDLVAECITAMREGVADAGCADVPVTVKTRIGIDEQDSESFFRAFVDHVAAAGCNVFIIHARKAWLSGLSPKQNRDIPPLDYDRVRRLKADRPDLHVSINGGITSPGMVAGLLEGLDGVMVGREAYQNPWALRDMAHAAAQAGGALTRHQVADAMADYADHRAREGVPVKSVIRHILGLFQGLAGARAWRRHLSEHAPRDGVDAQIIRDAARHVPVDEEKAA